MENLWEWTLLRGTASLLTGDARETIRVSVPPSQYMTMGQCTVGQLTLL